VSNNILSDGTSVSLQELILLRHGADAIDLSCHSRANNRRTGLYQSGFRGRGVDFDEFRVYQAGDEIRNMDWRVTARTGRPHIKLYKEEKERPLHLIVDLSDSMHFATRVAFKSVIASKAAATLAWAGCANGDRVGGLLFANQDHRELRPASGQRGVLPLLQQLAQPIKPTGNQQGSMSSVLERLRRVARPGSLIIIFSDFQLLDEKTIKHLAQLRRHNEIVIGRIYDPLEKEPPPANHYAYSDGVDTVMVNTQFFNDHTDTLIKAMHRQQIPVFSLATNDDIFARLQQQFGRRHAK